LACTQPDRSGDNIAIVRTVSSEGRLRAIVTMAAELFDGNGDAGVSMADIAPAAGIEAGGRFGPHEDAFTFTDLRFRGISAEAMP